MDLPYSARLPRAVGGTYLMSQPVKSILAIDTATEDVVVGISRGGEMLAESEIAPPEGERPRHSSALLAEIERAVAAAGGWDEVGRIGIGVGPGTYTGLRIGISTGLTLAQARRLPAVAVGTLTALALGIAERSGDRERSCLAALDARRQELFVQLHDGAGGPITEPAVLDPPTLADWLAETAGKGLADATPGPLAAGSGAVRFRRELKAAGVEPLPGGDTAHRLAARHLCRLAAAMDASSDAPIRPIYLREPDAKRWLERDRS